MDLPFSMSFITHALEREKEQATWDLWKSMYPNMMIGWQDFISYEDYKNKVYSKQHKYSQKTNDEIMNEMMAVVARHEGR